MKVLVTGAAGFLGRALVARLVAEPLGPGQRLTLVDQVAAPAPLEAEVLAGDIGASALLDHVADLAPDVVFHLAAVPGGASEADPRLSRRVNLDGALGLIEAACSGGRPRLVYASSIAVFGAPLPPHVDDETPAAPALTYGAHKLMVETALADAARRGALSGVALRLPGLVARPAGAAGLKSAFLSELFHALAARRTFTVPVAAEGTVWVLSVGAAARMLVQAARVEPGRLGPRVAINAPALRVRVDALAQAIAAALEVDAAPWLAYAPEPELQAQFAAYPPLETPAARALGLRHDGDLAALVARVLAELQPRQGTSCPS